MKLRIVGPFAVMVGTAVGVVACQAEQPLPECTVSHLSNFAFFDPKPGEEAKPCGDLTGDAVHFSKYNVPGTVTSEIALSVDALAGEFFGDPRLGSNDSLISVGDYDFEPNSAGLCSAQNMTPASVNLPASGPDPAVAVTYKWSNLRLAGLPNVPGTQFEAELEYTDGSCTALYNVAGLSPEIPCGADLPDGGSGPDESLCQNLTLSDGTLQIPCNENGECVGPDYALTCDSDTLRCRAAKAIPSLQ
jgi:hypothetical protein